MPPVTVVDNIERTPWKVACEHQEHHRSSPLIMKEVSTVICRFAYVQHMLLLIKSVKVVNSSFPHNVMICHLSENPSLLVPRVSYPPVAMK